MFGSLSTTMIMSEDTIERRERCPPRVVVCSGCCCGNIEKGHSEVPVDYLKKSWEENNLGSRVELMISGCLGPCKMNNVSVLVTESDMIWLGDLGEEEYYESLVEWGKEVARNDQSEKLPEILSKKRFEPMSVKEEIINSITINQKVKQD